MNINNYNSHWLGNEKLKWYFNFLLCAFGSKLLLRHWRINAIDPYNKFACIAVIYSTALMQRRTRTKLFLKSTGLLKWSIIVISRKLLEYQTILDQDRFTNIDGLKDYDWPWTFTLQCWPCCHVTRLSIWDITCIWLPWYLL